MRLAVLMALGLGAPASRAGGETALVLSGGGAKGAYEVGVLQRLCEDSTHANSWSILTGTSIGAMNAGALAQWPQKDQCKGVNTSLLSYWKSIKTLDDVMIAGKMSITHSVESCFTATGSVNMYDNLMERGGLCDPSPGRSAYRQLVSQERIRSSGMKLSVVSSSLLTAKPVWFDESDEDIVKGCIASGAIAPLVFPVYARRQWFADGGIFHNTPIIQALKRGASKVLVICLDADEHVPVDNKTMADNNVGPDIVNYYIQVATQEYMVKNELTAACRDYPHATIMGVVPEAFVGDLLGFTTADIEKMRQMGYKDAERPLVDMCKGYSRGSDAGGGTSDVDIIIAAVCGAVGGAALMLASAGAISYCRRRRNSQPNGGISPQSNMTAFAAGQYRRV
jgi:predicted acylesterase/phospholipase RssA